MHEKLRVGLKKIALKAKLKSVIQFSFTKHRTNYFALYINLKDFNDLYEEYIKFNDLLQERKILT